MISSFANFILKYSIRHDSIHKHNETKMMPTNYYCGAQPGYIHNHCRCRMPVYRSAFKIQYDCKDFIVLMLAKVVCFHNDV